jgi:hypothetical protein
MRPLQIFRQILRAIFLFYRLDRFHKPIISENTATRKLVPSLLKEQLQLTAKELMLNIISRLLLCGEFSEVKMQTREDYKTALRPENSSGFLLVSRYGLLSHIKY